MTRAASVLGIAQPALSRQMRLLEENLGVVLFRRTSRGVELTEEGERFRASTAAPLRQLELAFHYAGSPLARIERALRFGMHTTVANVAGTALVGGLSAAFPRMSFDVTVGSTDHLVEGMIKGAIDTAIINPVPDDRVFYREMLAEGLVVVGGPTTALRSDHPIEFLELAQLPLVMPASPTGIGKTVENAALRLKTTIDSRFATDSLQLAKELIHAGHAYGVLPVSACAAEFQTGWLCYAPLSQPELSQQFGVAASRQLDLPREVATKIGDVIREEVAQLTRSGAWPAVFLSPNRWNPNFPDQPPSSG